MKRFVATTSVLLAMAAACQAGTTINPTHAYAYGANVGWMNWRGDVAHGVVLGQSYCTGSVWSANAGWICLGNGPTNCWRYSNASGNDWGVNHDGAGHLSGCAYGANIGWINFEQTYGQPRVDLRTGNLSGYAYGANIGWISLSNVQAHVQTDRLDTGPDTDQDGLPDAWEYGQTNVLAALGGGGLADFDHDGMTDTQEYLADTDPLNPDDNLRITALAAARQTNTVAWTARPTRLYALQANARLTNAASWVDSGAGVLGPPPSSSMSVQLTGVTATTRFYRVQAIVPLAP